MTQNRNRFDLTHAGFVRARGRFVPRLVLLLIGAGLLSPSEIAFGQPPCITNQPGSQVLLLGRTAVFEVGAAGSQPMAYQWCFNGTSIPDATNTILRVEVTSACLAGIYQVAVSNTDGVRWSLEASLSMFAIAVTNDRPPSLMLWWVPLKSYRVEALSDLVPAREWQSVWIGSLLNANTATISQLTQIPEVDDSLASAIIRSRSGPDGVDGTEDDMPFRSTLDLMRVPGMPSSVVSNLYHRLTTMGPPTPISELSPIPGQPPPIYDTRFYRVVLLEDSNSCGWP